MASPLTWRNIAPPSNAAANALLQKATTGIGDAFTSAASILDKRDTRLNTEATNNAIAKAMAMGDLDQMKAGRGDFAASLGSRVNQAEAMKAYSDRFDTMLNRRKTNQDFAAGEQAFLAGQQDIAGQAMENQVFMANNQNIQDEIRQQIATGKARAANAYAGSRLSGQRFDMNEKEIADNKYINEGLPMFIDPKTGKTDSAKYHAFLQNKNVNPVAIKDAVAAMEASQGITRARETAAASAERERSDLATSGERTDSMIATDTLGYGGEGKRQGKAFIQKMHRLGMPVRVAEGIVQESLSDDGEFGDETETEGINAKSKAGEWFKSNKKGANLDSLQQAYIDSIVPPEKKFISTDFGT